MRSCPICQAPIPTDAPSRRKYCEACSGSNLAREHGRRKKGACSRCGVSVNRSAGSAEHIVCHVCRKKARDERRAALTTSCTSCGRPTRAAGLCQPCKVMGRTPERQTRECAECGAPFTPRTGNQKYCRAECREAVRERRGFGFKTATASERGYGVEHRRERARWKPMVDRGEAWCCLCGEPINPGTPWHLDHTPDRTGYRGVAHALCNVRDGAARASVKGNLNRPTLTKTCGGCGATYTTVYPKQSYCSPECRPRRTPKPRPAPIQRYCEDCQRPIKQGKRCRPCGQVYARDSARNWYRARVGIPLDAPKYDRSWRAA